MRAVARSASLGTVTCPAGATHIPYPSSTSAGGGFAWHTTTSDGVNVVNAPFGWGNTVVLSNEYAETMTDVNGGWTTADHTAEVGDLCGPAGSLRLTTGSFPVTSLWSNKHNDCVVGD